MLSRGGEHLMVPREGAARGGVPCEEGTRGVVDRESSEPEPRYSGFSATVEKELWEDLWRRRQGVSGYLGRESRTLESEM